MNKAEIAKIAKKVAKEMAQKPRKANRTLSLSDENYLKFQALCKAQELSTSEVVDRLIEGYTEMFK